MEEDRTDECDNFALSKNFKSHSQVSQSEYFPKCYDGAERQR